MEWFMSLIVSGITGAIISGVINLRFRNFEKNLDKKEESRSERDFFICKGVIAAIELASTMIKELNEKGHINGNTQQAHDYATKVKHDIEDFYTRAGSQSLNK